MLEASSVGRVAPKTKTINVEANLLSERLAERERLRERITRRIVGIVAIGMISLIALPTLFSMQLQAATSTELLEKQRVTLDQRVIEAQKQQETLQPILLEQQMQSRVQSFAERFVGETMLVMNAAPPSIAFTSLRTEVSNGAVTTAISAEAESSTAAFEFAAAAGKGPNTKSANLKSMRRSLTLGRTGVSFEFERKAVATK